MPESAGEARPRVLLMTSAVPYPYHVNGGFKVIEPVLTCLGGELDIDLVFPVFGGEAPSRSAMAELERWTHSIRTFPSRAKKVTRLLTALFHRLPLVYTLYSRRHFRREILPLVEEDLPAYRAILVQDTHIAPFISQLAAKTRATTVFVAPDYYTLMFRRISRSTRNLPMRLYHAISYRKLRRIEAPMLSGFDAVLYVSSADRDALARDHPELAKRVVVIENPVDVPDEEAGARTEPARSREHAPSVLFTGNMEYEPNRQAAAWFFEHVIPLLDREKLSYVWDIVGMHADEYLAFQHPRVRIHGSVPSLAPYLQSAALVVSPLQSGTGIKNKVLEGMAHGKVVIGSPLSFDGIPVCDGEHAVVAATPAEYADAIVRHLGDPEARNRIGRRARALMEGEFSLDAALDKWRELIGHGTGTEGSGDPAGDRARTNGD